MNQLDLWRIVAPTHDEIQAAIRAFGYPSTGLSEVWERLPQLVMIRRAVAVGFFNDAPTRPLRAARAGTAKSQAPRHKKQ